MVILGIILLIIGWLLPTTILIWAGAALIITGLILNITSTAGRRWY